MQTAAVQEQQLSECASNSTEMFERDSGHSECDISSPQSWRSGDTLSEDSSSYGEDEAAVERASTPITISSEPESEEDEYPQRRGELMVSQEDSEVRGQGFTD